MKRKESDEGRIMRERRSDGIKQHRPLDPVTIYIKRLSVPPLYLSPDLDAYAIGII